MNVIGKVHKVCELIEGESNNGQPWEKQMVVIETANGAGKPNYLAVEFIGENKTKTTKTLQKGDTVNVTFYVNCTEYTKDDGTSNWFTKLDGARIEKLVAAPATE